MFSFPLSVVDVNEASIQFVRQSESGSSTEIVVCTIVGMMALIGVAAMIAGTVMYTRKRKPYERLPLLSDE